MKQETSFGDLLRHYRKYYDYTQAEAAQKFGYSKETIRSWEQGRRFPNREEVVRLAHIMELDPQDVKHSIQIGRSLTEGKDYWTGQLVPGIFVQDAILDNAMKFGLMQAQLIALVNQWDISIRACYELQQVIDRGINMFDELKYQTSEEMYTLSRRQALASIAMLPVSLLHSFQPVQPSPLIPEYLLPQCTASITACWHLMKSSQLAPIEQVLSSYLPTVEGFARHSSRYQKAAASLACQGYILAAEIDKGNLSAMERYCDLAVTYGRIAKDDNLHVAALKQQATIALVARKTEKALQTYQQTFPFIHHTSPLLRARVYLGLASASARLGQKYDAQHYLGLAHDAFPALPEDDPCFLYTICDTSVLHLYDALTYMDINEPQAAWTALEWVDGLHPQMPVSQSSRIEIINLQASAAIALDDMERSHTYLEAGIKAAHAQGYSLWASESFDVYRQMRTKWPDEKRVEALQEAFVTSNVT